MSNSSFILSHFIEKDPGFIVGPISKILGYIINFVFKFIYIFTVENSLGLAIIIFTIIVKFLLFPLNYKQQKSTYIMQKIQPEIKKIQDKYKDNKKDPEAAKKMQSEISKIYAKYNCNPFGGCLPLFFQLPILVALYFIMKNSYLFISDINDIYTQIANQILNTNGYEDIIVPLASPLVPKGMTIDVSILSDLQKVINKFTINDWEILQSKLPSINISSLLEQKSNIEYFLGINLTEIVGLSFPKVLFAILSGLTTFLSTWIAYKKSNSEDDNMKRQQKIMNVIMPIMTIFFTVQIPCGVAIYWIVGNIIQVIQQVILMNIFKNKLVL